MPNAYLDQEFRAESFIFTSMNIYVLFFLPDESCAAFMTSIISFGNIYIYIYQGFRIYKYI